MVFLGHRRGISYRNDIGGGVVRGHKFQLWILLIAVVVVFELVDGVSIGVVTGTGSDDGNGNDDVVGQCCTFWDDDDVEVDIERLRPNNYLQCSMHSLSELREAVLRPGGYGVVDESDGLADMLRVDWKRWRVVSASRNFVIPTQPVQVTCMLHMECQHEGGGCNDMLFILPYHEAMQTSSGGGGVDVTMLLPTKTKLEVELLKGIRDPDKRCCHDSLRVTSSSDSGNSGKGVYSCRRSCFPALYRIILPEVVKSGDTVKLKVDYYLGKPYSPLQQSLARDQQQRVTLGTSSLFQCPYHTTIQRTYFSLLEELNIEVLSLHAYATVSEIKENVFLSGPYEKIELLSFGEELLLAVDYHESLEFIPNIEKHAYVPIMSFGDHITVYESYVVFNDASPLEGHFSQRILPDMETEQDDRSANYVLYMDALFPLEATDLRYYDVVGNIARAYPGKQTTSSMMSKYKPVDLVPRFPLLGGWKTTFTLEYRLPYVTDKRWREADGTVEEEGDGDEIVETVKEAEGTVKSSEIVDEGPDKLQVEGRDEQTRLWERSIMYLQYLRNMFDWLLRYASGRETVVSIPVYPAVYYMYIDKAVISVTLPPGAHVSRVSAPSYGRVEVKTRSRRLLSISIAFQEVVVYAERLALHDMEDYEKNRLEVAYKTSGLWLVKVVGALLLHGGISYMLFVALKWVQRALRHLGVDNVENESRQRCCAMSFSSGDHVDGRTHRVVKQN